MKKKAAKKAHKKATHIPKAKKIEHENMNIKFHHDRHFGSDKHNSHHRTLSDNKHVSAKKNHPKIHKNSTSTIIPIVTNSTNSTNNENNIVVLDQNNTSNQT